jgi:uncharacterized protein YjiS (DUF1127 family)
MSTLLKSPPNTRYDDLQRPEGRTFIASSEVGQQTLRKNCSVSTHHKAQPALLRDDHIVLLAIDGLLALHAAFKKWRQNGRTRRALADLDECQLRDVGLARKQTHYQTLDELDDVRSEQINRELSGERK